MNHLIDGADKSWLRDELRRIHSQEAAQVRRREIQPVRFRAADTAEGVVTGYITTFGNTYKIGPGIEEEILRGAFDLSRPLPVYVQHKWDQGPIGSTRAAVEDAQGVKVEAEIFLDMDRGRSIWRAMKTGSLREWSVGFTPDEIRTIDRDGKVIEQIVRGRLLECSVVLRGANPETSTTEVRGGI